MKKILWIGDGVISTGFARVSDSILNELKNQYEVHHLAINYRGDPHGYDYNVYPAFLGGDVFGIGRLVEMLNRVRPDAIIILQDPWIIDVYLDQLKDIENLPPIIVYFPVDAQALNPMWFRHFKLVSMANVYTEFARTEVTKLFLDDVCCSKINVIPHGVNPKDFYPIDQHQARLRVFPKEKISEYVNSFVILNANRNQPRKRIDLTIFGFKEFAKNKNDVYLYLHMGRMDEGWDIIDLMRKTGMTKKLILTNSEIHLPNVPISHLNLIYNATDVGINTSTGEGWGLTNWEHGATGKPQIVPNHSACFELWKEGAGFIFPAEQPVANTKISTIGRVASVESVATGMESAYQMWKNNKSAFQEMGRKAYELTTHERYSWKNIAQSFAEQIERFTIANNVSK